MLKQFLLALLLVSCVNKETPVSETEEKTTPEDCVCMTLFDPVCGEDGEEYSNSCVAECAGVKKWTQGPCSSEDMEATEK